MANGLDQPDELPLISGELEVAGGERPAEEGERPGALVKDGTEPRTRGVVVHGERPVEIRHLKDRTGSEGALERPEG